MKIVSCVIICQVGDCRFFPNINTSMPAAVTLRGWVGDNSRRVSVYIWDWLTLQKLNIHIHTYTFTICCIGVRTYTNIVQEKHSLSVVRGTQKIQFANPRPARSPLRLHSTWYKCKDSPSCWFYWMPILWQYDDHDNHPLKWNTH